MKLKIIVLFLIFHCTSIFTIAQILEVKQGKEAIVKTAPIGNADQIDKLPEGTQVKKIGEVSRYYDILLQDGRRGWSYKGNLIEISNPANITFIEPVTIAVTKQSLLSQSDLLKIIVVDVEVGDATIIICPEEDGNRDVIVIDTGENDSDRIKEELVQNGISLIGKPIDRLFITHYDYDHYGDAPDIVGLSKIVYDHGNNLIKEVKGVLLKYLNAVEQPNVDRRKITLNYEETFSGGVKFECVAVNNATDFEPNISSSLNEENANSIALVISYNNFEYFTGGDLTKDAENSLANGIIDVDVYHEDHHGSKSTSSTLAFLQKLSPEVSISSNGTKHGHPNKDIVDRIYSVGSIHFQTNYNPDPRAYQDDFKYIADDTYFEEEDFEENEGALGTINLIVDSSAKKYYVIMEGLTLSEGTFDIEQ